MFVNTPICPSGGVCDQPHACFVKCKRWVGPVPIENLTTPTLHFVGFKEDDTRYNNATLVFGTPDFVHRVWDHRARVEIMPGDVAVFAKYHPDSTPTPYSWDDSAQPEDPATHERT